MLIHNIPACCHAPSLTADHRGGSGIRYQIQAARSTLTFVLLLVTVLREVFLLVLAAIAGRAGGGAGGGTSTACKQQRCDEKAPRRRMALTLQVFIGS